MSKDYLESLERLAMPDDLHIEECKKAGVALTEDYDLLKQAILELTSIKKAEPSEALYELKRIDYNIDYLISDCDTNEEAIMSLNSIRDNKSCEIIKQALLKAQKEHKALEIIKEKDVDIYILNHCKAVDEYNSKIVHIIGEIRELTEEEFDLLKEVLE